MTENESTHYSEAERWLEKATALYNSSNDAEHINLCLRFADTHAALSVAADEDRLASCVPDGVDALAVSVRGR